jgi:hypothetical protein
MGDEQKKRELLKRIGCRSKTLCHALLQETVGQLERILKQQSLGLAGPGLLQYRLQRGEPWFTTEFLDHEERERQATVSLYRPDMVKPEFHPKEESMADLMLKKEKYEGKSVFRQALAEIEKQIASRQGK